MKRLTPLAIATIAAIAGSGLVLGSAVGNNDTAAASTPDTCDVVHPPVAPPENSGVWEISSPAHLVYLSVNQKEGSRPWRTRDFVQTASINLGGCLFTPIGVFEDRGHNPSTGILAFEGSYDGGHHRIDNLHVDSTFVAGLFGYTENATISRVALTVDLFLADDDVAADGGALIAAAFDTKVTESSATGSFFTTGDTTAGGLIGYMDNSSVEYSFTNVVIRQSENGGGPGVFGGLVGEMDSNSKIADSYARGSVFGSDVAGGLIGLVGGVGNVLTNSYATGFVSSPTPNDDIIGGLVGGLLRFLTQPADLGITESFWDTDNSETTVSDGGVGKNFLEMTTFDTFDQASWDIVDGFSSFDPSGGTVWGIRPNINDGYPYLLWERQDTCAVIHGVEQPEKNDDHYLIATVSNLVFLSENLEETTPDGDGEWGEQKFLQTAPIDLAGCLFTPIGAADAVGFSEDIYAPFTGSYDGQHYPIDNLRISEEGLAVGLFGATSEATIEKVRLQSVDVSITNGDGGALIGEALDTLVSQSSATGAVSGVDSIVGGLAGFIDEESLVRYSFANVTVSGEATDNEDSLGAVAAGGLIGAMSIPSTISNSYARGSVTLSGTLPDTSAGGDIGAFSGGLVGVTIAVVRGDSEPDKGTIENSYATGQLLSTIDGSLMGGLLGAGIEISLPQVDENGDFVCDTAIPGDCDPISGVAVSGNPDDVAKLVTTTNSYWNVNTGAIDLSAAGDGLTSVEMSDRETFATAGWDIVAGWAPFDPEGDTAAVWGIRDDLNEGFPFGLWEFSADPVGACGPLVDGIYQVSRASHLAAVGTGGMADGAHCRLDDDYQQTKDIALRGVWTPVGSPSAPFTGTFEGQMNSVTGLRLRPTTSSPTGMFGVVGEGGVIDNLVLRNVDIEGSQLADVGGVAGQNLGTITDSFVSGTFELTSSKNVGGFVGTNRGEISGAISVVDISATSDSENIGGLVGLNAGPNASAPATISDSANLGDVAGGLHTGGLVGLQQEFARVATSYSAAIVTSSATSGGLIGQNVNGEVIASFYDRTTSGRNDTGKGEPKTTAEMTQLATFVDAGWSISCTPENPRTVWGIAPEVLFDYPFPTWAIGDIAFDSCAAPAPDTSSGSGSGSGGGSTTPGSTNPGPTSSPSTILPPSSSDVPVLITPREPGVSNEEVDPADSITPAPNPATGGDTPGENTPAGEVPMDAALEITDDTSGGVGLLWTIGLGGLAALGLAAGGVVFLRSRLV